MTQQEVRHFRRTVVRHFKPHRVAVVAMRQLALQGFAQVFHLFLIHEQIGIARDAKLIAALHPHAGKQFPDMCMQHRRQEDEAVLAARHIRRQVNHARQDARRLHNGGARIAAESILALELDGEIEAFIHHPRKRMRRVEPDRREHRHHFAEEIILDPSSLHRIPMRAAQETDILPRQIRQDALVEQGVLPRHQGMRLQRDGLEGQPRGQAVRPGHAAAVLDLFLQAGDADFEEFIQIAGDDAQEFKPLQHRHARILGLRQHARIEGQQRQLAIRIKLGAFQCRLGGRQTV